LHCFILDLDGTVYRGNTALPHAAEFISRLNADGSRYVFFTNSPENSPATIERMLHSLSIPALKGSVITSGMLAVDYLAGKAAAGGPLRVNILGSRYVRKLASSSGLTVTAEKPDCVLASFSDAVTMGDIKKACRQIDGGAAFIATNPDDVIPHEDGLVPHTGAILHAITSATGKKPFIIGKPSEYLAAYFTALFGCAAGEICVVGDRLDTDMKFARNCGFRACLVLTGITSSHCADSRRKDFDDCFADLRELDLGHFKEKSVCHE
jgi:HAD superfamily hydrolase (TIGR01450 family)